MSRFVHRFGALLLLLSLSVAATQRTAAQDATPSAAPMTASDICNQALAAATPDAETAELPVDASFDLAFIDLMSVHHQRAIDMATIALERGERAELIEFAQRTAGMLQEQRDQLTAWRELWYPGVPALSDSQAIAIFDQAASETPGRGGVPGGREITTPPDIMGLCGANPGAFDLAFIDRLSSHYAGAILLSEAAVNCAEHPEVQDFGASTLAALQTDVDSLYAWRLLWFPDATPADID